MMNLLALGLTQLSLQLPAFRLASNPVASNPIDNLCQGAGAGSSCPSKSSLTSHLTNHVQTITNTLLYVAGAVAVVIIIVSGLRYITSSGDATQVKAAKDTLFYAIIGLVVVILAYAIVNFVGTHI